MKTPLISVVIPTFNREQYIRSAVESALAQTYPHIEILVLDDGSTDSTRQIIKSINDPRIRYIYTVNQGNYFARNACLKEAQGEYIAFLDSDDIFLPDKLSKQLEKFAQHPELGLCCGNANIRFSNLPGGIFEDAAHSLPHDLDTKNGFIERTIKSNFIITSTVMIRRECVKNLGYFDTSFHNAMDYEFFLRIIFNYPAYYMKDKLVERLIHPKGISNNLINTNLALVHIFEDCLKNYKQGKLFDPKHKQDILEAHHRSMYLLAHAYLINYQFDDAYRYFEKSEFRKKHLFRLFSMFVARYRISFLVGLIGFYRNFQNHRSLHQKIS